MTAGSSALSRVLSPSAPAAAAPSAAALLLLAAAMPGSWSFQVPWRETGEDTGVLSSSSGTVLRAGVAVSIKARTGAVLRGLWGKCVGV